MNSSGNGRGGGASRTRSTSGGRMHSGGLGFGANKAKRRRSSLDNPAPMTEADLMAEKAEAAAAAAAGAHTAAQHRASAIKSGVIQAFVSLDATYSQLSILPHFQSELQRLLDLRKAEQGLDPLDMDVARIEVAWHGGHVESVSFHLPREAPFLSEATKHKHMMSVDLTTAEERMKQTFKKCDEFSAEMSRVCLLSERFPNTYGFVNEHYSTVRWLVYSLVVLLNLNLLMVTFGEKNTHEKGLGFHSLLEAAFLRHQDSQQPIAATQSSFYGSVYLSAVLALLNLTGYVGMVVFHTATEVPILIARVETAVKKAKAIKKKKASSSNTSSVASAPTRDYQGAFSVWLGALAFVLVLIFLHGQNYPSLDGTGLYLFLLAGCLGPWFLACARASILLPDTAFTRAFAITYDVCVGKVSVRNNAVLMVLSILGFLQGNEFFSLMLLDIVNILPLLQAITLAISVPSSELFGVLFLFIVTTVIYAHFGVKYYEEAFANECHGVTSCFFDIMYNAAPSGDVGKVLVEQDNRGANGKATLMLRILFDVPYFVWCGTLLKSVITGLMISTFGKLRRELARRNGVLSDEAFVSGVTRAGFGDMALPGQPEFDDLNAKEQNPWNYVFFYYYLSLKPSIDYTGVESHIQECLDKNEWRWLPSRTSFRIQNAQAAAELEAGLDPTTEMLETIGAGIAQMREGLAELRDRLGELEEGGSKEKQ